ncbi:hypothetical protein HanIR_Chr08g0355791 [Helianthus annuus]|nr:hypothetical protein HanIR_Chr08g0355791 [Helianthus annuus]
MFSAYILFYFIYYGLFVVSFGFRKTCDLLLQSNIIKKILRHWNLNNTIETTTKTT